MLEFTPDMNIPEQDLPEQLNPRDYSIWVEPFNPEGGQSMGRGLLFNLPVQLLTREAAYKLASRQLSNDQLTDNDFLPPTRGLVDQLNNVDGITKVNIGQITLRVLLDDVVDPKTITNVVVKGVVDQFHIPPHR